MRSLKVAMLHNGLPIGGVRGKRYLMRFEEFTLIGSYFSKERSSISIGILSVDVESVTKCNNSPARIIAVLSE